MKLVQFTHPGSGEVRAGYVQGDGVVDLNAVDPSLPSTLLGILRGGLMERVRALSGVPRPSVPLQRVRLAAPVLGMDKVLCIGLNYRDHCAEAGAPPPPLPVFFSKFSSAVAGPEQAVRLRTGVTASVDYEVEMAAVILKTASDVSAAAAHEYVLGYTVAQDLSARDWQNANGGQVLLGKSMDTFCPLGPWIVTGDEVGDPHALDITCSVNGVLKQKSNTGQIIHRLPEALERLTSVMTLLPGDVILTGTPGGVGAGRNPPEYLRPGDLIESEVERIGVLRTRVEQF